MIAKEGDRKKGESVAEKYEKQREKYESIL
jgi:hypothetical protein